VLLLPLSPTPPTSTQGAFVSVDTVYLSENAASASASFRKVVSDVVWMEWLAPAAETVDKVDTILLTRFKNGVTQDLTGLDLVRWEAPFDASGEVVARSNCYKFEQVRALSPLLPPSRAVASQGRLAMGVA